MKVWVVFREREWDWQTHKEIDSVHATEELADKHLAKLGCFGSVEEFEVENGQAKG